MPGVVRQSAYLSDKNDSHRVTQVALTVIGRRDSALLEVPIRDLNKNQRGTGQMFSTMQTPCPVCKTRISVHAQTCPHCGAPFSRVKEKRKSEEQELRPQNRRKTQNARGEKRHNSLADDLIRLAELRREGLLTQDEFNTAKIHLLAPSDILMAASSGKAENNAKAEKESATSARSATKEQVSEPNLPTISHYETANLIQQITTKTFKRVGNDAAQQKTAQPPIISAQESRVHLIVIGLISLIVSALLGLFLVILFNPEWFGPGPT